MVVSKDEQDRLDVITDLSKNEIILTPDLQEPVLDHGDVPLDAGDVLGHEAH